MKYRRCLALLVSCLWYGLLGHAASATTIPVPTGLNPGDQYRMVFWTVATRDATSSDIEDYNDFVTSLANSVPELEALYTSWTAIASTASVDARDNTGTNPLIDGVGFPIFGTGGGTMVAADNADLWDGTIAHPIAFAKEGGVHVGTYKMWTGSNADGTAAAFPLGHPTASMAGVSQVTITDSRWVADGVVDHAPEPQGHFYAMSGVLTAGATPVNPNVPDLIYDAATGEVVLDPDGAEIYGFLLQNESNAFLPDNFTPLFTGGTAVTTATTSTLYNVGPTAASGSLGPVFPTGLDLAGLQDLLSSQVAFRDLDPGGTPPVAFDLVVLNAPGVPEPSSAMLSAVAAMVLGIFCWLPVGPVARVRVIVIGIRIVEPHDGGVDVTQIPHVLVQGILVRALALFEQLLVLVVVEGQIDPARRFLDTEVAAVVLERGKGAGQIGIARAVVVINTHQPIPGIVDVVLTGARAIGIRSRDHVARGVVFWILPRRGGFQFVGGVVRTGLGRGPVVREASPVAQTVERPVLVEGAVAIDLFQPVEVVVAVDLVEGRAGRGTLVIAGGPVAVAVVGVDVLVERGGRALAVGPLLIDHAAEGVPAFVVAGHVVVEREVEIHTAHVGVRDRDDRAGAEILVLGIGARALADGDHKIEGLVDAAGGAVLVSRPLEPALRIEIVGLSFSELAIRPYVRGQLNLLMSSFRVGIVFVRDVQR